MIHFGTILKKRRKAKGLTQVMLAGRSGMTAVQLCKIEKGQSSPNLETIERLADALDVSIGSLLSESVEESKEFTYAPVDGSVSRFVPIRLNVEECAKDGEVLKKIVKVENRILNLESRLKINHSTILPFVHSFMCDAFGARTVARYMRAACAVGAATFADLAELLEIRNVRFHVMQLSKGIQSRSYFDSSNHSLTIVLEKGNTPERNIYRIAYELAWAVLFGSSGFKPVRDSVNRHRFAREFASEFLMPEESVRFTVSQLGIKNGDWTIETIAALKSKFNVSAEAFALRLEALNLISPNLRQNIREQLRAYYKAHPEAMEPKPSLPPLRIGMRINLLEIAATKRSSTNEICPQ